MNYVYPEFPEIDLYKLRLGGCGLGNLLFIYSRAMIYALEHEYPLIWPTWMSVKIGPYVRREKDKRLYNDLFVNNSGYIDGARKIKLLLTKKQCVPGGAAKNDRIFVFDKRSFKMNFDGLYDYRQLIYEDIVRNLNEKNAQSLKVNFDDGICVHIRLGDFTPASEELLKANKNNVSTPILWYVKKINEIRDYLKINLPVYLFSDGTDEQLKDVLKLENVKRIDFGTSIGNILALSRARLLLASGSSTSMWARFLGDVPALAFTNQLKEKIQSCGIEEETDYASISDNMLRHIKELYNR